MFDHFAKHQGQHFALLLSDGGEVQTELVEVRALPAPAHADRTPFSLLFKGPAAPLLPQQIYRLRQPLAVGETFALMPRVCTTRPCFRERLATVWACAVWACATTCRAFVLKG
jgi:hypothetical protein